MTRAASRPVTRAWERWARAVMNTARTKANPTVSTTRVLRWPGSMP